MHCARAGVDFVLMRHEANAGIAAAVYGKLRGQPGVVVTTLGPGAANLMLPLSNAYLDQEPLLAISAQLPDDFPASHTHQLLPLHDVYRPVDEVRREDHRRRPSVRLVPRALTACMNRPFGAAYLTLSAREAMKPADAAPAARRRGPERRSAPARHGDAREEARELRGLLGNAKRPLVLIGLGIDPANAARIRQWVNDWDLPVAVTPKVKGIVDETIANFVGVVGGMAADDVMCEALKAADLLIGFGLDPVEIDKHLARRAADSLDARGRERRRHRSARHRSSSITRSSWTRCWARSRRPRGRRRFASSSRSAARS